MVMAGINPKVILSWPKIGRSATCRLSKVGLQRHPILNGTKERDAIQANEEYMNHHHKLRPGSSSSSSSISVSPPEYASSTSSSSSEFT